MIPQHPMTIHTPPSKHTQTSLHHITLHPNVAENQKAGAVNNQSVEQSNSEGKKEKTREEATGSSELEHGTQTPQRTLHGLQNWQEHRDIALKFQ